MTKLSIDLQALSEIKQLSASQKAEIFTIFELSDNNDLTLAGKLAAKKAFLKCLSISTKYYATLYPNIEIKRLDSGRPFIETSSPLLLKKLSKHKISISISHTKDIAIAVCIIYNKR